MVNIELQQFSITYKANLTDDIIEKMLAEDNKLTQQWHFLSEGETLKLNFIR